MKVASIKNTGGHGRRTNQAQGKNQRGEWLDTQGEKDAGHSQPRVEKDPDGTRNVLMCAKLVSGGRTFYCCYRCIPSSGDVQAKGRDTCSGFSGNHVVIKAGISLFAGPKVLYD